MRAYKNRLFLLSCDRPDRNLYALKTSLFKWEIYNYEVEIMGLICLPFLVSQSSQNQAPLSMMERHKRRVLFGSDRELAGGIFYIVCIHHKRGACMLGGGGVSYKTKPSCTAQ